MARIILCDTKIATTSYIFPNTKIEVFSYEELCYYIYNNISLIAKEYITTPLFLWIEQELEMPELAMRLRQIKEKDHTDLTDLLATILTYQDYYNVSEVKDFIFKMERMKGLTPAQYRKLQADGFLRYHKYIKAVVIYDEILEQYPDITNEKFLGKIYHNRGVALSHNFELEEATKSYLKAYELLHDQASIYEYLMLNAMMKEQSEVEQLAKQYGVEELLLKIYDAIEDATADIAGSPIYHRLEKAIFHFQKNNLTDFNKRLDTVLEQLKTEFREQII